MFITKIGILSIFFNFIKYFYKTDLSRWLERVSLLYNTLNLYTSNAWLLYVVVSERFFKLWKCHIILYTLKDLVYVIKVFYKT